MISNQSEYVVDRYLEDLLVLHQDPFHIFCGKRMRQIAITVPASSGHVGSKVIHRQGLSRHHTASSFATQCVVNDSGPTILSVGAVFASSCQIHLVHRTLFPHFYALVAVYQSSFYKLTSSAMHR